MSIEDLGAIGEFISSIAVVISLIYLAMQIRENTRTQRVTAAQDVMSLSASNNTQLVLNPQLFVVLTKAGSGALSPDELGQYRVFLMSIFAAHWQAYFLFDNGLLEDEIFQAYERRTRGLLSRTSVREWWETNKFLFAESYQKYVDRIISVDA